MFKDVPLTQDELRFLLEKVLRLLPDLDLADIPALTYQLLLLATKVTMVTKTSSLSLYLSHKERSFSL